MAEIEFSALARQCLDRRIKDQDTLQKEVLTWSEQRNEQAVKFTGVLPLTKPELLSKVNTKKSTQITKNTPSN